MTIGLISFDCEGPFWANASDNSTYQGVNGNDEDSNGNDTYYPDYGSYASNGSSTIRRVEEALYSRVIIAICCVGIVGNFLNLIVLTRKRLQKSMGRVEMSSHCGLTSLAVSDLLFCVAVIPYVDDDIHLDFYHTSSFSLKLLYIAFKDAVINTLITASTMLTVAMAVGRYIGICHPLKARQIIRSKLTRAVITVVFVFSIIMNMPRFWQKRIICTDDGSQTVYFTGRGYLSTDGTFRKVYMSMYFIMCIVFPFITLTYCTYFLVRALSDSAKLQQNCAQTNERSSSGSKHVITLTLSIIVILNILFVCPAEILNFVGEIATITESFNLAVAFANTLQALNFSLNFALYCAINVSFRQTLADLLCCRICRTKTISLHPPRLGQHRESISLLTSRTSFGSSRNKRKNIFSMRGEVERSCV